jgi:hypothetical protein
VLWSVKRQRKLVGRPSRQPQQQLVTRPPVMNSIKK